MCVCVCVAFKSPFKKKMYNACVCVRAMNRNGQNNIFRCVVEQEISYIYSSVMEPKWILEYLGLFFIGMFGRTRKWYDVSGKYVINPTITPPTTTTTPLPSRAPLPYPQLSLPLPSPISLPFLLLLLFKSLPYNHAPLSSCTSLL